LYIIQAFPTSNGCFKFKEQVTDPFLTVRKLVQAYVLVHFTYSYFNCTSLLSKQKQSNETETGFYVLLFEQIKNLKYPIRPLGGSKVVNPAFYISLRYNKLRIISCHLPFITFWEKTSDSTSLVCLSSPVTSAYEKEALNQPTASTSRVSLEDTPTNTLAVAVDVGRTVRSHQVSLCLTRNHC